MDSCAASSLVNQIDQCLPQTQCTLCTYPRCRQYARAIARGEAGINQCPPGGEITIAALSRLLTRPAVPLNQAYGTTRPKQIAYIDEPHCIGCKLCIKACPVDCIVGSAKLMHTVIANDCTGCKLCIPVCPTDCIQLVAPDTQPVQHGHPSPWPDFTEEQVTRARCNTEQTLARNRQREQDRRKRKRRIMRKQMQQEILAAVKRKSRQSAQRHRPTNLPGKVKVRFDKP